MNNKKARINIIAYLYCKLIIRLSLGSYLILITACNKLAGKLHGLEEPHKSQASHNIEHNCIKEPFPKKEDIHKKDSTGRTALHQAAQDGNIECMEFLLKNGANINAQDHDENTPLYYAAKYNQIDAVKCLIKHECDVNIANEFDNTPMHIASGLGYLDIVNLLLQAGAEIKRNDKGDTPIHTAGRSKEVQKAIYESLTERYKSLKVKEKEECSICLKAIYPDKLLFITSCAHYFHEACIGDWIKDLKNENKEKTCPNCRAVIESGYTNGEIIFYEK
ncbi:MAG: ankyrin repeat domain-containing protein [Candidatus Cardinium sp.]|uniref:ankyrin repeat domain-containing protein n=1 Tax=Cardinium endosymbiont of Dermatophagoides farinae TaxID=2597823 RepID=UPI0011833E7A|nr:ankyrin repeat domain-containing protein [Cardinium endosymbiont of Dermatophagoides farinae]TSJ81290.1 hypothetical protein FPG78_04855 [Cardinium endosymbiont of Dermatophagoides farinae]UWW97349.1 MAG: ankyrin repeat domain-containing protein [Candidatus Cardinium sp.]